MAQSWEHVLTEGWLRRGWVARLLRPLSWLMRLVVALRAWLYRQDIKHRWQAPVPVVVVGNVVAGGAGKTPVVMALAAHLRSQALQVGVISRGYGRHTRDCREVRDDSAPGDVGDEPLLIHRRTRVPVFVAARRVEAAQALLAAYPGTDVLVCDDGLQHLALERDLEICVFDDRGAGNGLLLPAGPLREPWPRAVDLILHTGNRPANVGLPGYAAHRALAPQIERADGQAMDLAALAARSQAGTQVIALAGVARPQAFFDMLEAKGVRLAQCDARPDHDDFSTWQRPAWTDAVLLCTEKDAAKLWLHHPDAWAVPLEFTPEPAFFRAFDAQFARACERRGLRPLSSGDGHPTA